MSAPEALLDTVRRLAAASDRSALASYAEVCDVLVCLCMWCNHVIELKDSQGAPGGISHSACTTCLTRAMAAAGLSLASIPAGRN